MKTMQGFNLDVEIIEELKSKYENISATVNQLLKEHLQMMKPLKEIHKEKLKEVDKLIEETNELAPAIEKEEEDQEKNIREQQERAIKLDQEKREERKEKSRAIVREVFNNYNIPEEKIEEELDDFFEIYNAGLEIRPIQFLADKHYTRKEKFVPGDLK